MFIVTLLRRHGTVPLRETRSWESDKMVVLVHMSILQNTWSFLVVIWYLDVPAFEIVSVLRVYLTFVLSETSRYRLCNQCLTIHG
jgi:hypothetical protein